MKYSTELTFRDSLILSFLKEQGVATSEQLTRDFFKSYGSFRKRISYLIRGGLIEAVPLAEGVHLVPSRMAEIRESFKDQGKSWQKIKLYRLSGALSGSTGISQSPLGEPIFWQHQLGLNEIRHQLAQVLVDGVFLSDPESKAEWARFRFGSEVPIPDLVWRKDSIELAVEYERTNKGETKYFERMAKYQRSQYQKIIFVANTDDIQDVLRRCSFRFPKIGITSRSSFQKVYVGISGIEKLSTFFKV